MSDEPILRLRNISKSFGSTKALDDITLDIYPGNILCLLGDNGAGKSTLIKVVSGYHPASSGHLELDGKKVVSCGSDFKMKVIDLQTGTILFSKGTLHNYCD